MKRFRNLYLALFLGYLLGIHHGYIALWQDGNGDPTTVFPYRAQMLPVVDQMKLAEGIHISDHIQLQQLLEDYLS